MWRSDLQIHTNDTNKFILLFQKVVYLYKCVNDWEQSNEMLLPEVEYFYSRLNMEEKYWFRLYTDKKFMQIPWFIRSD